jgi:YidC/Oxa1 family membrane protein insertase
MERSSLLRFLLLGAAIFLFIQFGLPLFTGKSGGGSSDLQPLGGIQDGAAPAAEQRKPEQLCDVEGPRFKAQLTSRGGALKHAWMNDAKYRRHLDGQQVPIDLVSTSLENRAPLRTNLRDPFGKADQVAFDDFDWELTAQDGKSCTFTYRDETTALEKKIAVTDRPFELSLSLEVKNLAKEAKRHRLTIEQTDWRTQDEATGSIIRPAVEYRTVVEVRTTGEIHRFDPSDFEPDEFDDETFTDEKWRRSPGPALWSSVSSTYFSKAILHVDGPQAPAGETQIEERWRRDQFPSRGDDPQYGHVYRSRLNYDQQELGPGASVTYKALAYLGPKEREVLAAIGGTGDNHTIELLDLGMFGVIGKVLIGYLYWLFGFVKHWAWAICLLTITVKLALFPLSIAQIRSSMGMRKLQPQMQEINEKFKDDATQRGLAMQELWRKNKMSNPVLGCLPVLLQMPVWYALYTALQTAVELYHTPFLWLADLSAPDPYFVLPVTLGLLSILQQRLMPMQGDPTQQKIMRWMMPAMFTVFMLFLPAGLGIYFLTNTMLSIGQQLGVERFLKSQPTSQSGSEGSDEPSAPGDESAEGEAKRDKRASDGKSRKVKTAAAPKTA